MNIRHCTFPYINSDLEEQEEPIYEVPTPKYNAERLLRILLDPDIPTAKICSTRPINITKSATYVVDISKLEHAENIKNDNFGIWKHSGSHPQTFRVNIESDGYIRVEKGAPGATGW